MKISVNDLYNWISAGSKMTGDKDTEFYMFSKKDRLYLVFIHPLIQYCKRISIVGELADICLDMTILRPMLAGKHGEADMTVTNDGALVIKGKGFKYSLTGLNKDLTADVASRLFSIKGQETAFVNVTPKITKALKGIQDKVTESALSVRVQGDKNTVRFLLTDNHHGLLITQKLKSAYSADEIILPIDTFFKVIGVASSKESITFHQSDAEIIVQSKTEYLSCRLKATSNANISVDMMEQLTSTKPSGLAEVSTEQLMTALATCKAIVAHSPVVLNAKQNTLLISMNTAFSKTSEKIDASVRKDFSTSLNVSLLMDVVSAMFDTCTLTMRGEVLNLASSQDDVSMQGVCVAFVEEDDAD